MSEKPEALRLAERIDLRDYYDFDAALHCPDAAIELRRLYVDNERLTATLKAREDEILTHCEAFYEATKLLSEEREKNERLREALGKSLTHEQILRIAATIDRSMPLESAKILFARRIEAALRREET